MPTVLCLDDFTCGLAEVTQALREAGYRVLAADDNATALSHLYLKLPTLVDKYAAREAVYTAFLCPYHVPFMRRKRDGGHTRS